MPLCRIKRDYTNVDGWKAGDIKDITNPWTLIKEGNVVLVDSGGTEIAPPAETRSCPICLVFKTVNPYDLAKHIMESHPKVEKPIEAVVSSAVTEKNPDVEVTSTKAFKDMTPEERKAWRLENLRKARVAASAKKEAALTAEAVKKAVKNG